MRYFLITLSFINTLFYILIYAYYDNILGFFGVADISAAALYYIKLLVLLIIGFCIGINVMLLLRLKIERSLFSFKNLVIIGIVPFISLILSQGSITSFIITRFFNSSNTISELAFYLFSRQTIWSLWLGFAIGSSVRFSFVRKKHKHMAVKQSGQLDPESLKVTDT